LKIVDFHTYEAQQAPNPTNVLGVFGLSIRTREEDLQDEFSRFGHVDKVTIVYDQRVRATVDGAANEALTPSRQSDRSRGFGFIKMATVEEAGRCITELNGIVSRLTSYVSTRSDVGLDI
jgi:transformer-2 protein